MSVITIERKVLEKNDAIAQQNREVFKKKNLFTMNLVSSPGSGKTSLIEKTIHHTKNKFKLVQLELRKRELLGKYTENNRFVQEVDGQIRDVQQRLSGEESRRYGRSRYGVNPSFQQIRDDLLRNEVELKAMNAKLKTQGDHMGHYTKRLDQLASNEINLNDLQSELEVDRKNYQLYLTKVEESRISNEMDSQKIANVSVLRPALIPLKPVKPNILLNLGLGFGFAVFGSLGLAFGLELFRDHFEKPYEVEAALGAPVLASIPHRRE